MKAVFYVTPIRTRSEAQDGVLEGILNIIVAGVPGVTSKDRGARERDKPY